MLNQQSVFPVTQIISFAESNVNPNTVRVLSPAGVPYLKGADYTVQTIGHMIQIQRVVGGLIPANGNVLIDYNLLPTPGHVTDTANYGAGIRYEIEKGWLKGLSPYARYGAQDQSIQSDSFSSTLIADSYQDIVVGTDYRIWQLTFNAEQQWYDSTLSPFDASRVSAQYGNRIAPGTNLSLAASYVLLNYYDVHDWVKDATASAAIDTAITREWKARARVVWLDDQDELFGNTRGLEEQLEIDWHHNETDLLVRFRNSELSAREQKSTLQEIEFGLSRKF